MKREELFKVELYYSVLLSDPSVRPKLILCQQIVIRIDVPLTQKQQQAQNLIHLLIRYCWKDPDFKRKLIKDPVNTIEEITGVSNKLPDGTSIKVEDQSDASVIYLNIPPKPKTSSPY